MLLLFELNIKRIDMRVLRFRDLIVAIALAAAYVYVYYHSV